jgi:maltose O-acetyltransferase
VIGEGCEINENVFIQGAHIGRDVLIAPNVSILTTTHNYLDPNIPIKHQGDSSPQVPRIESDVWIGRNAIILPGVIIGQGSVVGAGAIVTKNIEPFSVYGGVPAKFIKKRDKNDCC